MGPPPLQQHNCSSESLITRAATVWFDGYCRLSYGCVLGFSLVSAGASRSVQCALEPPDSEACSSPAAHTSSRAYPEKVLCSVINLSPMNIFSFRVDMPRLSRSHCVQTW